MQRIIHGVIAVAAVICIGCGGGEGTERPEDCDTDEYYDEVDEVCLTCPAVVEPECLPGCPAVVVEDDRDCPVLRCEPECPGCDDEERWDDEEKRCV